MKINRRGLTLTEVLIVVVILGVLASMVIPRYLDQKEYGFVAEASSMMSAIRQSEAAYQLENSAFRVLLATDTNATWQEIGIDKPDMTNFEYAVDNVGQVTATRTGSGPCSAGTWGTCTITLSSAGGWGGTHPFRPK